MIRRIIKINEEKCNGCGACAAACHEGAIQMVDGVAKLIRDDYCDGLGDCLPACPTNAISFEEREALPYDEAAVEAAKIVKMIKEQNAQASDETVQPKVLPCGCPGTQSKSIIRESAPHTGGGCPSANAKSITPGESCDSQSHNNGYSAPLTSQLSQWPVQIKLVPINAPYFNGANLLIAADCTAYAYGNFHNEFIRNRITLIGCPKLDEGDYTEKLTQIIANNDIKSVTIVRMEVPCCGGIENAAKNALQASGKFIPWQVVTVTTDGRLK